MASTSTTPAGPAPAAPGTGGAALVPWTQVWTPELYENPTAAPATDAAAQGRLLATTLLDTQGLYVYDHRAKEMLFVSPGVERLLGLPAASFTMESHYNLIHPDDCSVVTEATVLANQYCIAHRHESLEGLVFAVDYRLRHAAGHWVRVLRQNFCLSREESGALVAIGGLLTDITVHKQTNDVRFHVNRPDFADFVRRHRPPAPALTVREQQVLTLVLDGLTSAQIAAQLHLSAATVDTHRRNIRQKTPSQRLDHLLRHLAPA